jgi:hypothetical protein
MKETMGGRLAHIGKLRNACRTVTGKRDWKILRLPGRSRYRCDGSMKMYFKEIGCGLDSSSRGPAGFTEHGDELLVTIKDCEFLG